MAVLDIDAHHGEGTQSIFCDRADVMTLSVRVDPDACYPFFTGRVDERGRGEGGSCSLNIPLALGWGDEALLAAIC